MSGGFVGTPLYLSPEAIRNMRDHTGYGFEVDWCADSACHAGGVSIIALLLIPHTIPMYFICGLRMLPVLNTARDVSGGVLGR